MSTIKLSICIPTYNFGAFIGETLSAVIDQSRERARRGDRRRRWGINGQH